MSAFHDQWKEQAKPLSADENAKIYEVMGKTLSDYDSALWKFEVMTGERLSVYPGGFYSEKSILLERNGVSELFNVDKVLQKPEIWVRDVLNIFGK